MHLGCGNTGLPMLPRKEKLTIPQGQTFRLPVRWETEEFVYAPISAVTKGAPCRVTTSTPHGVPDGWRVALVSLGGMVEANTPTDLDTQQPDEAAYRLAKLVSGTELELNDLNTSAFGDYTSGGYVQFRRPKDLTGYTARMAVKDKVGGVELLSLTAGNARISIDPATCTVTLRISADDTAALTFRKGVYDLELISPSAEVTTILTGAIVVVPEVTT